MYNDMQLSGGLKLRSGRTLSDYKNFDAPKSGWHPSTVLSVKNRFDKMKAHAKLGRLFFDEVKIKVGLVFDSSNWELVGFTDIKDDNFESGTSIKSVIATRVIAIDLRHSHIHLDSLSKKRVKLAIQTLSSKVAEDVSKFESDATSSTQEFIINCEKFGRYLMTQNQSEMMMQEFKCLMRSLSIFYSGRNLCLTYIILNLSKDCTS